MGVALIQGVRGVGARARGRVRTAYGGPGPGPGQNGKKSGRAGQKLPPTTKKNALSRRGGNASDGMEPKTPMYLSLIFGLIVRQVDS